jgi:nucleoid-associated protein YgaU
VGQNETLSAIAARLYGDPALWRPIALRNGLSDPRRLPMGSMLIVPQLPFVDALTGEVYE